MNNKQEEMEETNMKMIKAIVRPEKSEDVLDALLAGGFAAATKMSVLGRGKQKGLKVGDTYYDEIPKELIMLVVEDKDVDKVLKVIITSFIAAPPSYNSSFPLLIVIARSTSLTKIFPSP